MATSIRNLAAEATAFPPSSHVGTVRNCVSDTQIDMRKPCERVVTSNITPARKSSLALPSVPACLDDRTPQSVITNMRAQCLSRWNLTHPEVGAIR